MYIYNNNISVCIIYKFVYNICINIYILHNKCYLVHQKLYIYIIIKQDADLITYFSKIKF